MDPGTCPHCGGANPLLAVNCQWCGAALPPRPVSTAETIEFDVDDATDEQPDEPDSLRNTRWGVRLAVLVVALILIAAVFYSGVANPPSNPGGTPLPNGTGAPNAIQVIVVEVYSPDDACGLNGWNAGGFSGNGGMMDLMSWWLPGSHGTLPCSVSSVSTNTSGFSLTSNLPVSVTSGQAPLVVTAYSPPAFSGVLNLTFR